MLLFSFSFQPADQYTHLRSQIGNHDNENHQQKSIRIDDPQNIHAQASLFLIPSSSFIVHRPLFIVPFNAQYEDDVALCQGLWEYSH
jgi:hypothetical protein